MSVTITPQKADSNLIIIGVTNANARSANSNSNQQFRVILTNSSNTGLSGAEDNRLGMFGVTSTINDPGIGTACVLWGYVAAGSTAAQTFKMRFAVSASTTTCTINNGTQTGQMYAIEVSA